MVIGGQPVAAASGETFDVVSPVTGAVIARVPKGGARRRRSGRGGGAASLRR